MSESPRYSKLAGKDGSHEDEEEVVTYQPHPLTPASPWHRIAHLLASFFVGMLTMGLLAAAWSSLTTTNRAFPDMAEGFAEGTGLPLSWFGGECGSTPKEASSNGCRYSAVLHAWLPERCLFDEDDEDAQLMYKNQNQWGYQLSDGTNMTSKEMRAGEFEYFYTSNEWHIAHCMYVWKRAHRAMMDAGRAVDAYTASMHHTNHCVKMISGDTEDMEDYTKVFAKYPKCS